MFADLHHHLIYGIDDGAQTAEDMQQMLRRLSDNNVSAVAATSHAEPGRQPFPLERYRKHLQEAQEWCDRQGLPLRIYEGAEIFYTDDTVRLLDEGQIPTIAGQRTVLVEFSPAVPYDHVYKAVRKLGNAGYMVILAHAERYRCLRKIGYVEELREEFGALIQINARTLIEPGGFMIRRWLRKMMEAGYCDLAATDAHNVSLRSCMMQRCYDTLNSDWGEEIAIRMCINTPLQLLRS